MHEGEISWRAVDLRASQHSLKCVSREDRTVTGLGGPGDIVRADSEYVAPCILGSWVWSWRCWPGKVLVYNRPQACSISPQGHGCSLLPIQHPTKGVILSWFGCHIPWLCSWTCSWFTYEAEAQFLSSVLFVLDCLQLAKQEELFSPLKCGPAWVPFTLLFSWLFLVVHTFHTLHPPHRHCAERSNIGPVSYRFWNFPISCNGNLIRLDPQSPFPLPQPWVNLPLLFVSLTDDILDTSCWEGILLSLVCFLQLEVLWARSCHLHWQVFLCLRS